MPADEQHTESITGKWKKDKIPVIEHAWVQFPLRVETMNYAQSDVFDTQFI